MSSIANSNVFKSFSPTFIDLVLTFNFKMEILEKICCVIFYI